MKKLFYMLLALPMMFGVSSCSDDKEVPDAEVTASFSGVYTVPGDNVIYAVLGDPIVVESVTVDNHSDEQVALGPVTYIWNGFDMGTTPVSPFKYVISTDYLTKGNNLLTIRTNLLVVDHPIYTALVQYKITVVPDEESLPDGATLVEAPTDVETETHIQD